jgi:hypothetical protein
VWSGIALAGLAVVLLVVSGPLRRRRVEKGRDKPAAGSGSVTAGSLPAARGGQLATRPDQVAPAPAKAPARGRKARPADDDDDLGDVADILKRHGIT